MLSATRGVHFTASEFVPLLVIGRSDGLTCPSPWRGPLRNPHPDVRGSHGRTGRDRRRFDAMVLVRFPRPPAATPEHYQNEYARRGRCQEPPDVERREVPTSSGLGGGGVGGGGVVGGGGGWGGGGGVLASLDHYI